MGPVSEVGHAGDEQYRRQQDQHDADGDGDGILCVLKCPDQAVDATPAMMCTLGRRRYSEGRGARRGSWSLIDRIWPNLGHSAIVAQLAFGAAGVTAMRPVRRGNRLNRSAHNSVKQWRGGGGA